MYITLNFTMDLDYMDNGLVINGIINLLSIGT
jgi:hypothetical protein